MKKGNIIRLIVAHAAREVVYVGLHKDAERCPIEHCKAPRYTEDPRNRTSVMQVNYRSLTLIICDLLHTSLVFTTMQMKKKQKASNYSCCYNRAAWEEERKTSWSSRSWYHLFVFTIL